MSSNFQRPRRERRRAISRRGEGLQALLEELDSLIGLEPVKTEIFRMIDFARIIALKKERDLPVSRASFHMVFTGPPGTGKTTVARLIGKLLFEINLLRKGTLVEADRSKLVGSHLGETAKIVEDVVKDSLDGVLFVDEAYTLAGGGGPTGKTDPFGQEAIDTLLKLMEDHRERLVVIFAGYTTEMRRFVEANPGLKSRISRYVEFPSYDEEELFKIFEMLIEKNKMILTDDAWKESRKVIAEMARSGDENFGNARDIRQFFESLQPIQAERIAEDMHEHEQDPDQLSDEELMTITEEDVHFFAQSQ